MIMIVNLLPLSPGSSLQLLHAPLRTNQSFGISALQCRCTSAIDQYLCCWHVPEYIGTSIRHSLSFAGLEWYKEPPATSYILQTWVPCRVSQHGCRLRLFLLVHYPTSLIPETAKDRQ